MGSPVEPLFGANGPLAKLEENPYGYKELRYPRDMAWTPAGGVRYPYYMKFYINIAEKSKYADKPDFVPKNKQLKSTRPISEDLKPSNYSTLFRRKTYRSQQSILLYMPDTLNWSFGHNWKNPSMTEELGKVGMGVEILSQTKNLIGSFVGPGSGQAARKEFADTAMGLTAEGISKAIDKDPSLGLAAIGLAQNPNIEILYNQPELRTFQFEFIFAPRNKEDADTAIAIIQLFKFHAAPENATASGEAGRYFVPPSDFDIEFQGPTGEIWQFGKIIPNAVLRNITVNYGQSGQFSVFPGDYPTNIQLMLEFQETQFITKGLVNDGY